MKINVRLILTGLLLVLMLVAAVTWVKHRRTVPAKKAPAPSGPAVSRTFLKVKGPDTAPVKLVEYSDFECPSCRVANTTMEEIFRDYPGKIQMTYKHFPLTSHRWSIYAHQAAECMQVQGKFWSFHDKLYEKQQEWSASQVPPLELFAKYAQEQGAEMKLFAACLSDVGITREIYAEKEEGVQRQISATPTFFLGEARFVGPKQMKEQGINAIRKVLGLPEIPVPLAPPPITGALSNPAPQNEMKSPAKS